MGTLIDFCRGLFNLNEEESNTVIQKKESDKRKQKLEGLKQSLIKEIKREEISENKFSSHFQIQEENEVNEMPAPIELEVIHVEKIGSTMPASREYIDQGNKLPFIYNTEIQTDGKGKGDRKWAGMIKGNLYTSSCIPVKMIKNELNSNEILVKITAISIIQILRKYSKDQFFLKHPNDIICKDVKKLGGIIVELYKDFYIIGFGINIVDKPEEDKLRKSGLSACYIKEHLPFLDERLNALELSIDVTKQIIYNLKFISSEIDNLFEQYVFKK